MTWVQRSMELRLAKSSLMPCMTSTKKLRWKFCHPSAVWLLMNQWLTSCRSSCLIWLHQRQHQPHQPQPQRQVQEPRHQPPVQRPETTHSKLLFFNIRCQFETLFLQCSIDEYVFCLALASATSAVIPFPARLLSLMMRRT